MQESSGVYVGVTGAWAYVNELFVSKISGVSMGPSVSYACDSVTYTYL